MFGGFNVVTRQIEDKSVVDAINEIIKQSQQIVSDNVELQKRVLSLEEELRKQKTIKSTDVEVDMTKMTDALDNNDRTLQDVLENIDQKEVVIGHGIKADENFYVDL